MNPFTLGNISNTSRAAELQAETESALQVANRQDRINEAYRQAVEMYTKAVNDYPLGDKTDDSLLRMAQILETELKDRAAAMQTYQKIVKLFPGTPVAEDAAWKVALFHEQEGKYKQAAAAYRDFIRNYPASSRVADAQFALAEVLEQLGHWVDAMDAYETFRQKFNGHPKALVGAWSRSTGSRRIGSDLECGTRRRFRNSRLDIALPIELLSKTKCGDESPHSKFGAQSMKLTISVILILLVSLSTTSAQDAPAPMPPAVSEAEAKKAEELFEDGRKLFFQGDTSRPWRS